jgi:hypothetical protein
LAEHLFFLDLELLLEELREVLPALPWGSLLAQRQEV